MGLKKSLWAASIGFGITLLSASSMAAEYDLIIRNGAIYDGSGNPPVAGDLAIKGDTIAAVGQLNEARARREINAQGQAVAPFLDELATEMAGRVTVAKVNIDENPQTPRKYGVRGIPTMILFKDGQVAATKIGALPKSKLYEWVESVL